MAIGTPSMLARIANTSNVASYSTASYTPTANALLLAFISQTAASTASNGPPTSVTGNGLTWVNVGDVQFNKLVGGASTLSDISVWRAMGAAPTAGALTVDYGATNRTGTAIMVVQITGTNTGGTNGSGAIGTSNAIGANLTTNPVVTLTPTSSSNNLVIGAVANDQDGSVTSSISPAAGWTQLDLNLGYATPGQDMCVIYGSNKSTGPQFTMASADWGGVAVEVIASSTAQTRHYSYIIGG